MPTEVPVILRCPVCHQSVEEKFYFCPNCGKSLREKPLSTSLGTQLWIYAFSIILPVIAYLAISYWPGIKYWRSGDPKAQEVGVIATVLLVISSIVTFWLAIVWIQQTVQQSMNAVGNIGNFGSGL